MRIQFLLTMLIFGMLAEIGPPAPAAAIIAQLFPLTGEIRFTNRGLGPVPIALYSISSPSGALNGSPAVWRSIEDFYDASGNGLVDPVNEWHRISSLSTELAEGVVGGPGGNLPPMQSIGLGRVWNPNKVPFPDLTFELNEPSEAQIGVTIEYTLDGDYSGSGTVDSTDYQMFWRATFGSSSLLLADGNLNGAVDAADYVVWRKNLGRTAPWPPYAAAASAVVGNLAGVPEPTSEMLLLLALAYFAAWPSSRRQRH